MSNPVTFESKSGEALNGVLAEPPGEGKAPAIVLLQEWWGVNDHIKSLVDRFAKEGFLVIAPDLYHGKIAKDGTEAASLMTDLDTLEAVKEIAAAMDFVRKHPRSNGKVGVTGFCMGGALALATACHVPEVGAAVSFYGMPPAEKVDYAKVTAPIMMHIGEHDEWVTPKKAGHIRDEIEKHGKPVELFVYVANHAFVNDTRPEVYSAENAQVALDRTYEFFKKHLA